RLSRISIPRCALLPPWQGPGTGGPRALRARRLPSRPHPFAGRPPGRGRVVRGRGPLLGAERGRDRPPCGPRSHGRRLPGDRLRPAASARGHHRWHERLAGNARRPARPRATKPGVAAGRRLAATGGGRRSAARPPAFFRRAVPRTLAIAVWARPESDYPG